jgi:hypothetical protein
MPEPTVRTFHAKLLETGYNISLSGAQRFIARHIKKPQPKSHQTPAAVGRPLTLEELSLIQKDLTELKPLDAAALKIMLEKELLVYNIMLMRFSQRKADRLAMAPKETAALVKSMSGATGKISAAPIPVITPDGRMIDVAPNQVVDDIDAFFRREGAEAIGRFQLNRASPAQGEAQRSALSRREIAALVEGEEPSPSRHATR